jgi:hypothetical protein
MELRNRAVIPTPAEELQDTKEWQICDGGKGMNY